MTLVVAAGVKRAEPRRPGADAGALAFHPPCYTLIRPV